MGFFSFDKGKVTFQLYVYQIYREKFQVAISAKIVDVFRTFPQVFPKFLFLLSFVIEYDSAIFALQKIPLYFDFILILTIFLYRMDILPENSIIFAEKT